FALLHRADREQGSSERLRRHRVQEVALILAGIDAAKQPRPHAVFASVAVAGSAPLGTESSRVVETHAELDLAIAQHVRIRRAAGTILLEEIGKDPLAVFARETHLVQRNAPL